MRRNRFEERGLAASRLSLVIGFVMACALAATLIGPVQHKVWELFFYIYSM